MPKIVKMPKSKTVADIRKGVQSKYDWNAILKVCSPSEVVAITHGEDFAVDTDTMPPKIKSAARRRYLKASVYTRDTDGNKLPEGTLWVHTVEMTPDERAAEDILRIEEKRKLKAAAAESNGNGTTEDAGVPDDDLAVSA